MYLIYSVLLAAVLLLGIPYWVFQMVRQGKYRKGLSERLGIVPPRIRNSAQPSIWVHAVSVGEVLAVSELVRGLRAEFPEHRVVVSTTTDTGQKLAAARFGAENVFYFPLDFAVFIRHYVSALRPELVVVAETEFWPNFLRIARESGARIAVVNARISDRSLSGYRRWRKLLRPVLQKIDLFLAQTAEDARRLAEIGAAPPRISVGGNLKFDISAPPAPAILGQLQTVLSESGAGPILVCGSTVDGEESLLVQAFKAVLATYPATVMLLAPRHPERFGEVAQTLEQLQVNFWKRTKWNGAPLSGGVLLVDSIGELSSLYGLADLAFVGGSLVPRGGHSIIEPAQHGVAILVGPHTENFRDIVTLFQNRNAVRIVAPSELASAFLELLGNDSERQALGSRAIETLTSQRGATPLTLQKLKTLLPARVHEGPSCVNPLGEIYGAFVGTRNYLFDRGVLRSHTLAGPVVSVGNISVGGSGKTPFLIWLGELLKRRGIGFDVLSRGYGRKTRGVQQVAPEGSAADFGDEPLLIAQRLGCPVIVGESRYQAGLFAESKFGPQLHILDDGFQHRSLARDFDIVVLTAEDARDRLLPGGRLREPVSSLSRADS